MNIPSVMVAAVRFQVLTSPLNDLAPKKVLNWFCTLEVSHPDRSSLKSSIMKKSRARLVTLEVSQVDM